MRASADSKTSKETNGAVHQPEANVQRRAASPCPFLGIAEDAATSFAFATPANHCFCQQPSGRRPPVPVELHHQETYCLTNQYATCPIFQHAENGAVATLPAAEEARPSAAARLAAFLGPFLTTPWRNRLLAVVLVLLVLAASLYFTRDGFPVRELGPEGDDSNAKPALATVAPTGEALVAGDEQNTPTPTSPPSSPSATVASEASRPAAALSTRATSAANAAPPSSPTAATRQTSTPEASPTPSPSPVPTTCGAPAGWVNYIVQPGENLFRISLRYNTTMAQLMQANCLTSTSVFAGQALLVPFQAPVPTPSSVPQATTTASPTDPPPPPEPTDPPPAPTATPQPQSSPTPPTIEPPAPSPTATAPPPTPPLPPTATPPLDEEITPTVEATPPPPPEG